MSRRRGAKLNTKGKPVLTHADHARIAMFRASGKGTRGKHTVRKQARREALQSSVDRQRHALKDKLVVTATTALEFVRLLHAGLPQLRALAYLGPAHMASLDPKAQRELLSEWLNDPLVAKAASIFNKGEWHELDKETRIDIALAKHASELAYLLYTQNINEVEDSTTLRKITEARSALLEMQRMAQGGEEGAFARMVTDLLTGKLTAGDLRPPQLDSEPMPLMPVSVGESVPIEAVNFANGSTTSKVKES